MGSLQTTGYSREFININPNDIFLIYQLSVISYQLSAISYQLMRTDHRLEACATHAMGTAISYQPKTTLLKGLSSMS
ncbi:hypothetical protein [Moorena producens]|uniref:hypothetical protein n=1 Tax=Moorena producens TaxID=1155739 RepID=UPI003C76BE88